MTLNRRTMLGTTLAAGSLAGAARAQQAVTLDVLYCLPSFARFHEPVAAEFMKRQSATKIQFRAPAPNYDEGHQVMVRSALTNQLPDVYYSGYHLLPELVRTLRRRNQIVEVGPMLDKEPEAWRKANYSEQVLALGKVDAKLYGMAFNASTPIMYFNEDLVKRGGGDPAKMPDTFEDVLKLAAQIHKAVPDVAGIAYDIHAWPDDWLLRAIVLQSGGKILNDAETEVAFGGEAGLKGMRLARRFVTEGGMQLLDWDQSQQAFVAGKTAIYFHTPAVNRQIADLVGTRFKVGTAKFPIDDKANGGIPTGGNAAIITARDAPKQAAAWEFLKFVTGPEAQKIVVETTGYMPTNIRAVEKEFLGPFYDANPNFRTVFSQAERARPWQGYPGSNSVRIWRLQRDIIGGIMRGETAPDAGLAKMVAETNALLK